MSAEESIDQEYVAIIGMAGRFPGARDIDTFWRNLREGVESISQLTPEELAASGIPPEVSERSDYVPAKGILEDPEHFDAEFFGLTPREAEVMDPQHRLFLECCWQACEDAGYNIRAYSGRAGVYAGGSSSSYLLNNLLSNPELLASVGNLQARLGNDQDFLTTRASYKLNLRGPSFAVQTACSTSLLAVHLACQGLLDGECSLALAGGVSVSYPHRAGYFYLPEGIRSPDGHCRAFDAGGAGSVEGNGVGMVVLKRLSEALADGDTIRAVIRGSASNNDGSLKAGFTAPSVESQSLVISEALSMAGVSAATVGYVEAHGSGTLLGDPIEVEALSLAFGDAVDAPGSCALGSVKTSIGHLDAAAGIASLIKTARALEAGILPPSPYFQQPNPSIDFAASPFYINREARPWPSGATPRRAGVSSFGIGGTNVHAVLEEAPARDPDGASRPWQLLVLSARSGGALAEAAAGLHHQLEERVKEPGTGPELADVAYTLGIGRERFQHRRALVCRDPEEALAQLGDLASGGGDRRAGMPTRRAAAAREPGLAMLFPGLGDHHAGMTRELYRQEPTFRQEIDRCADFLRPSLGIDLREVLYPEGLAEIPSVARPTRLSRQTGFETSAESAEERRLHQTLFAHPILFMTEVALARLLMEWGLRPAAMIGYSLGEYTAAHLAGVFSLEDGLALVAERARMIDELPGGAMLAIPLAETELSTLLEEAGDELSLAAANGHSLSVVGGPGEAVDRLAQRLAELGVACQRLRTTHAFHSKMLEPIRERLRQRIADIPLAAPEIPFLSNTTGTWIRAEEATNPAYWAEHTVLPVRFSDSLGRLMKLERGEAGREHLLLEVGPGQGLSTLARQHEDRSADQVIVSCLPDRRDGMSEMAHLLTTVGRLWTAGAPLDWQGFYRHQRRRRVPLPAYPFQRQRYCVEPGKSTGASLAVAATSAPATTRKAELEDWFYLPSWERTRPVTSRPMEEPGSWLLLLDELGLGARLAERLRRLGQRVLTVAAGSGFGAQPNGSYTLDPGRREDYQALVAALEADDVSLRGIVYLFGLTPESDADDPWVLGERFDQLMDLGFYSLLFLAQALGEKQLAAGKADAEAPSRTLTVISNQLHEVTGEETLCPAKAMLLGPMKVIPQEVSHWTCRGIDVVVPTLDSAAGEQLIADLMAELTIGSAAVDDSGSGVRQPGAVIAYRGRHRWRRTFPRVRLEKSSEPPRLRRGGVYVVTGGADETSLVMAEHLARRVAARLVLLVAEDFPRREDWESLTSGGGTAAPEDVDVSPENPQLSRAIRRLQALEERSGALLLLPVDLTDPAAVAKSLAAARQRFGEINGVLHTAMVAGGGLIQLKTRQAADAVLAPKVAATLALARALEEGVTGDRAPDFFALFSSNVAVTGGLGQVDFAAANAFLDAFARRCALRGGSVDLTLAIDWGSFRWEAAAAGMPEVWEQLEHNLEAYGIDAAEGAEVLERALAAGLPQVVVSPRDLAAVRRDFDALTASSLLAEIERGRSREGYDRPELEVAYAAPSSGLEENVANIWREVFGLGKVGVHDNFFDLSGNSLLALQIVTRVRTDFQVGLPMTSLFEAPTVAELARQVEDLQGSGETVADGGEEMGAFYALLSEVEGLSDTDAKTRLDDVKSEGTDG